MPVASPHPHRPHLHLRLPIEYHTFQYRRGRGDANDLYCDSWRLSVETNNAGSWYSVPSRCLPYVREYMTGISYISDSEIVAADALGFAKSVEIGGDGKDAWVFDIDETSLTNLPYYEKHGFGAEPFDELSFDVWVELAEAPALPASLSLYKELKELGFTVLLLTGRSEYQRSATEKNLLFAGYTDWEKLLLRYVMPCELSRCYIINQTRDGSVPFYEGVLWIKASQQLCTNPRRSELINEGYRIHGSSGDQWSDLWGFAVAERSFKLPNPMYYIK